MAFSGSRRRVRGDRAFRKLLRRFPDSAKEGVVELLEGAGDELLVAMRAAVPTRTGALRAGLSKKVLKGAMRLKVGLIGKGVARRLFYGRIVEFGRKAQTVTVRRRSGGAIASYGKRLSRGKKIESDVGSTYQLRVSPMRGRPFVLAKRPVLRAAIGKRIDRFWNVSLARAAAGVSDA